MLCRLPFGLFQSKRLLHSMPRTYSDALDKLNSLQSNAAVIADIRANWADTCHLVIPETTEYLHRAGYKADDLNALNVIHIAGTKGKGSTSAFCSSLLSSSAPNAKIGLYTSPHLVAVCERIRINGVPISEEMFARYFFQIWDRFDQNIIRARSDTPQMPAYFRYLTIMAFHVFLQEKVDATVLEVGIGGTYDATNLVPKPRVTAITALGLDHTAILGKTLPEIASQKAGIYKKGVPALTVEQPKDALSVVRQVAEKVETASFEVVAENTLARETELGLAGDHQVSNASLALAAVRHFLTLPDLPTVFDKARDSFQSGDSSALVAGLQKASFPGRCQMIPDKQDANLTWALDGAHTTESLECCARWFGKVAASDPLKNASRVLVFNCTSDRTGAEMLSTLTRTLSQNEQLGNQPGQLFTHAVFCPNTTYANGQSKSDLVNAAAAVNLDVQNGLADAWRSSVQTSPAHVFGSISESVDFIKKLSPTPTLILVTGSLHLVGGIMEAANLV